MDNYLNKERDLEETIEKYSNIIFRTSFLLLRNKQDTDDVLQETFYQYWINENEFASEEHKKAWLLRVSQNKCKNILKYKKIHSYVSFHDIEERVLGSAPKKSDDIEELLRLSNLNNRYKSVIMLFYLEGYSIEETAEILEISQSAVKKRLQRGREKLKSFFEKYDEEGGNLNEIEQL